MKQQTQTKKLKEVADIKSGFAFKSSEFSKQGIPIIRISNIINGEEVEILRENQPCYNLEIDEKIKNCLIKKLDILIALSGATTGKIGIYKQDKQALLNQRIALIRSKNEESKKYIYYFLQTKSQQILKDAYGGAQPNISPKTIENYEIFFPNNKEQTLIVQEIEKQFTRLDAAVKSLKSVKQKLEVYRKAVLKNAFEKKEGWEEKTLKEACEKITDGAHYTPRYVNEGYPFITVKNRKDNQIDFENIKKISKEDFLKLKKHDCNPKQGDVLFSKDGTVGEVIKIDYEKEFIILSSWAILRPSNEIIQNYLYWFMRSPNAFNQAVNMKTGTAIRRIVLRNLKEVDIQFPESKKEQFSIVQSIEAKFSVIDKIEQVVNESLKKAEKLRKSILKSAFEGKLVKMEEVGK